MKNPHALAAWQTGLALEDAAFQFASEYEKEKYRKADDQNSMEVLGLLMRAELIGGIYEGEFVCFGLNSGPSANRGPEPIDRFLFRDLSKSEMITRYVDWNESSLNYAGQQYTAIRVIKAFHLKMAEKSDVPKKMGRPPIDEELKAVISKLKKRGAA
jgi:hypothetical protein